MFSPTSKEKGHLTKAEKKNASPMLKKGRTMLLVLLRQEEKGEPCISNFEAKGESCFRQLLSVRKQRGFRKRGVDFSKFRKKRENHASPIMKKWENHAFANF